MPSNETATRRALTGTELLGAIRRDLHLTYTEVLRQPLPAPLESALRRSEARSNLASIRRPGSICHEISATS